MSRACTVSRGGICAGLIPAADGRRGGGAEPVVGVMRRAAAVGRGHQPRRQRCLPLNQARLRPRLGGGLEHLCQSQHHLF